MLIASMNTTISISQEMKEKLRTLGRAGDSYDDVIRKMYEITKRHVMLGYLYDETDSVSIEKAIADAKNRWHE